MGELVAGGKTLKASGTRAYSIGGADGWTLTDMFENIYLRTFGPAKYAALSAHTIKWTDPSVITALKTMAQVIGDSGNLAGGRSGALQYGFNDSVTNAFTTPPKAALVFEGDFVAGVITSSTKAKPGTGFDVFPFPTTKTNSSGANGVEIGGDLFVTFRDTPAIEAFVKFLATAPAAEAWAKLGGFATGNNKVPASIYPDAITRATALPIAQAKSVVFDMSDEQPASFGATTGQGEWGIFQDFLRNPSDPPGIAKKLEKAAAAAYTETQVASVAPTCRGPPANPSGRRARRGSRAEGGSTRARRTAANGDSSLNAGVVERPRRSSQRARLLRAPTSSPGKTCSRPRPRRRAYSALQRRPLAAARASGRAAWSSSSRSPSGRSARRDRGGKLDDAARLRAAEAERPQRFGASVPSRAGAGKRVEGPGRGVVPCAAASRLSRRMPTVRVSCWQAIALTRHSKSVGKRGGLTPRKRVAKRAQERVGLGEMVEG